jgi:hypothetical protein
MLRRIVPRGQVTLKGLGRLLDLEDCIGEGVTLISVVALRRRGGVCGKGRMFNMVVPWSQYENWRERISDGM